MNKTFIELYHNASEQDKMLMQVLSLCNGCVATNNFYLFYSHVCLYKSINPIAQKYVQAFIKIYKQNQLLEVDKQFNIYIQKDVYVLAYTDFLQSELYGVNVLKAFNKAFFTNIYMYYISSNNLKEIFSYVLFNSVSNEFSDTDINMQYLRLSEDDKAYFNLMQEKQFVTSHICLLLSLNNHKIFSTNYSKRLFIRYTDYVFNTGYIESEVLNFINTHQSQVHENIRNIFALQKVFLGEFKELVTNNKENFLKGTEIEKFCNFYLGTQLENLFSIPTKAPLIESKSIALFLNIFYVLQRQPNYTQKVSSQMYSNNPTLSETALKLIYALDFLKSDNSYTNFHNTLFKIKNYKTVFDTLILYTCYYWLKKPVANNLKEIIENEFNVFLANNSKLFVYEYSLLLSLWFKDKKYEEIAKKYKQELGLKQSFVELFNPDEVWRFKLTSLQEYGLKLQKKTQTHVLTNERIAWFINIRYKNILPFLQKLQKNGTWSKGRQMSFEKLLVEDANYIIPEDKKIIQALYNNSYEMYDINDPQVFISAIGHPNLFLENSPEVPLFLEKEDVYLQIDDKESYFKLYFSHKFEHKEVQFIKKDVNTYKVLYPSKEIIQLHSIIGNELKVPKEASEHIFEFVKNCVGSITIHSPLVDKHSDVKEVAASEHLYAHILPVGEGFKIEIFVKPLAPYDPYVNPGVGLARISSRSETEPIYAQRNLSSEKTALQNLLNACPALANGVQEDFYAIIQTPLECLMVLSELKSQQECITIEWPKGEKIGLRGKISISNFKVNIKHKNNWFNIDGEVTVNDTVLSLKNLFKLLETKHKEFIEIENGQFIELEKHFLKQLEFLKLVSTEDSKSICIHPLTALAHSEIFEDAFKLESDAHWKKMLQNFKSLDNTYYELPHTIDAELRPYQIDGYQWLCKLYDWGAGACLADDMGLGKTLQCIALLVRKMQVGPSLVVAPASVCKNWVREIERFAPHLQAILFSEEDRKSVIETAEAGAVVIVSYGLLNTEAELLSTRQWNICILDEAHAIKNINTKRSQVVMSLQAAFKIAATGTPIQNHVGELFNIFQFINPGLLGAAQKFNSKFLIPIEKNNDELARKTLKDIIKPFILRRTKNQVLQDLPPKTEIPVYLDFSNQERDVYEALRQNAIEDLESLDDTINEGEKHLRVLAHITKLRLMCCNSKLVLPQSTLDSTKLQYFTDLLTNLIDNNHKALVFSQFLGHLSILREVLETQAISYEYLDGQTSLKEREERIRNFQAGNSSVFLISLKAGGVGINLTAADYVIHVDPWWNPAIEDQASDRAHRIGQTKPVTIYRLIIKNSIEEAILQLHTHKRSIADSLLEGTEMAHKVKADELIELLRQRG